MSTITPDEETAYRRRFGVAWLLFTALFVLLAGRFFYLQIVRGAEYSERARTSFTVGERIPPRRGRILDRTGKELARNVPRFELRVVPHHISDPEVRDDVLGRLAALLEMTRDEQDTLAQSVQDKIDANQAWQPVVVREGLVSTTCPYDSGELALVDASPGEQQPPKKTKKTPAHHTHDQLFCNECGLGHHAIEADAKVCPHDRRKLTWDSAAKHHATCPKCRRSYVSAPICPNDGNLLQAVERNLSCPVCKRRFSNEVAVIKAQHHRLPGVDIHTEFMREYPARYLASHILGYVNYVTRDDRERYPGVYTLRDRIGRAGIEAALEPELRGESGRADYFKGTGKDLLAEFKAARNGYDVALTIDARLQRAVRQNLRYNRSGAAVVMDPRTGEVLAMYSTPGYDPNAWSGRLSTEVYERIKANPYYPMVNKAVTPYAPGSVYKIVTALAGLSEGVIDEKTEHHCSGTYEFGGRVGGFRCHNRSGHGTMTLVQALKYSCDVYFYKVGEQLGMDRLARYGDIFGFGLQTGIELASPSGRVPTKKWHNDHTRLGFQPGLTLSVAIGQGSLTASPLHVARAFSALANGGRVLEARLVKHLTDDTGDVVQRFLPVEVGRLPGTPEQHALIREGLVRVVNDSDGTAPDVAMDAVVVAGKTGTAEAAQSKPGADEELKRWLKEDHAWFAAYAPADDPQVVVVAFLEHGGAGGKNAGPVVKRILEAWIRLGMYRVPTPPTPTDGKTSAAAPAMGGR